LVLDFQLKQVGPYLVLLIQNTEDARQDSLDLLNKTIDLNIAKIAHDMRTPINSILMSNNHLQTDVDMPELFSDSLKQQESSCHFILNIMEGLIDVSKLTMDKFD
jgi:signal transduction histidine kinase